jgi:hypothetical protein
MLQGDHEAAEALFGEAIDYGRGVVPHVVITASMFRAWDRLSRGAEGVIEASAERLC